MQRMTPMILLAAVAGAAIATIGVQATNTPARAQPAVSAAAASFATCDVLECLERMLDSPQYADEREATAKPWNDQIQLLANELTAIRDVLSQLQPNDPTAQGQYQQYQSLAQRINSLRAEADADIDQFAAQQLADAYAIIHVTVQEVCEELGYSSVVASRLTIDDMDPQNTNAMVQEVMMRPVLRAPSEHDITVAVIAALDIPEPAPEPETPAEAEGPSQPEAGDSADGG